MRAPRDEHYQVLIFTSFSRSPDHIAYVDEETANLIAAWPGENSKTEPLTFTDRDGVRQTHMHHIVKSVVILPAGAHRRFGFDRIVDWLHAS